METLRVIPKSLEGKALFILNQLRGGARTDDDSYRRRLIRAAIVTQSAVFMQQDLNALYNRKSLLTESDLLIDDTLTLEPDAIRSEYPVVYYWIPRPPLLMWNGDAAISYIKTRHEPTQWGVARSENGAVQLASSRIAYEPAKPAYWVSSDRIRIVVPQSMSLIEEVDISYASSDMSLFPDGSPRDVYEDEFPLPERIWDQVWKEVLKTTGGSLLQTSPNRDETNNGADTTVQPAQ